MRQWGLGFHALDGESFIPVYHLGPGANPSDLALALDRVGVEQSRNVITVVGGAAGTGRAGELTPLFDDIVLAAKVTGSAIVFGATDSGVLAETGKAIRRAVMAGTNKEYEVPLIGVAAVGTVAADFGDPARAVHPEAAPLQAYQHALITMQGREFGDESPAIAMISHIVSRNHRSATVLINGGGITKQDAVNALAIQDAGNHLLFVVEGTGRAADEIAAAKRTAQGTGPVRDVAANARTRIVSADSLGGALREQLLPSRDNPQPSVSVPELVVRMGAKVGQQRTRTAYDIGRMLGAGYGSQAGRSARTGETPLLGDPAVQRAWVDVPSADRRQALERLTAQAKRLVAAAAPPEQVHALGARIGFWSAHDYAYDNHHTHGPGRVRGRSLGRNRGMAL